MPPFRLLPSLSLAFALTALTACGDNGKSGPDADVADAVPTGPCVEFLAPSMILNSYPATHQGDILGSGAEHTVAAMDCTKELTYWDPAGEELVVRLDDLTPDAAYAVVVDSPGDLSFYVSKGCTDDGTTPSIASGDCLLFVDAIGGGEEVGDFVAPASGRAYVVIDHFVNQNPLADGSFTLKAYERECMVNADCTADAARPFCDALECVACTNSFQCADTDAPVCDNETNACVAGHSECTGDDPTPPEDGDDGPSGALALTPAAMAPAVVNAKICGLPNTGSDLLGHQDAEADFYKFDLLEGEKRGVSLVWTAGGNDLDLYLFDANGAALDTSFFGAGTESIIVDGQAAGTYYLAVAKFEPDLTAILPAAVDYTLTLTLPECESDFDCLTAEKPVCGPALVCEEPGALCSGDDDNEPNDGPADATALATGVLDSGVVCNTPATERDYYSIVVADGDNLDVTLTYVDATNVDLDVAVFSADGTLQGTSFWLNPEIVNLTFLPAGTYYIVVSHVGGATAVPHAYDILASVTGTAGCVDTTSCAAVYNTQIYRGQCKGAAEDNPGACVSIEGAEALILGVACDSGDDCTSGICSNLIFQRDAQTSVCTIGCVADTTCTDAHGAGFKCTIPFANNKCHPECAGDLDCGAVTNFNPPDEGQPWDYLTCNVGVCELSM